MRIALRPGFQVRPCDSGARSTLNLFFFTHGFRVGSPLPDSYPPKRCKPRRILQQAPRLEGKCSTRVVLLVSEICQPFESDPDDDGEGAQGFKKSEIQLVYSSASASLSRFGDAGSEGRGCLEVTWLVREARSVFVGFALRGLGPNAQEFG